MINTDKTDLGGCKVKKIIIILLAFLGFIALFLSIIANAKKKGEE